MSTESFSAIALTVIAIAIITAVKSWLKRISSGCCGSGFEQIKAIKVSDRCRTHYPYHRILKIEGMHCSNCARKVENALNSQSGIWAKADAEKGQATVYLKTQRDDAELIAAVEKSGYSVTAVCHDDRT